MRVIEALKNGILVLDSYNIEDSEASAKILLSNRLNATRANLICMYNDPIDKKIYKQFLKDIAKRSKHMPVSYITGKKEFFGLNFNVNKNTLIPRGDTEVLVIEALNEFDKYKNNTNDIKNNDEEKNGIESYNYNIIDMCTGSGCIGLSLASKLTDAMVYLCDIKPRTLKVAKSNGLLNNITNAKFIRSNLFNKFNNKYDGKIDMIVSNPPYIKKDICKTLEPDVRLYEPMIALDGGFDGLDFYKKIIKESARLLKNNGILAMEIDYTYGDIMKELLSDNSYTDIRVIKDLNNLDRVVIARLNKY